MSFHLYQLNRRKCKNILFENKSKRPWSFHLVFLWMINLCKECYSTNCSLINKWNLWIPLTLEPFSRFVKYINNKFEFRPCGNHQTKRLSRILIIDMNCLWFDMVCQSSIVKLPRWCLTWTKFRSRCRLDWLCLYMINPNCKFWFDKFSL